MSLEPLLALAVCALTFQALTGGFALARGQVETNLNGSALILGLLSIGAGVYLAGPVAGLALVIGIAIHEYGHVAAYRAMGHTDARYRLVPFLGGLAISKQIPRTQLAEYYVIFMGPGIMLAPLVISGVLWQSLNFSHPMLASYAYIMFAVTGAINFFNLLPLWPLDGGRILRVLVGAFSVRMSKLVTLSMSGLLIFLAFSIRQPLILIVGFLGLRAIGQLDALNRVQKPMRPAQAGMGLAAYLAMLAAHGMAGQGIIRMILDR